MAQSAMAEATAACQLHTVRQGCSNQRGSRRSHTSVATYSVKLICLGKLRRAEMWPSSAMLHISSIAALTALQQDQTCRLLYWWHLQHVACMASCMAHHPTCCCSVLWKAASGRAGRRLPAMSAAADGAAGEACSWRCVGDGGLLPLLALPARCRGCSFISASMAALSCSTNAG